MVLGIDEVGRSSVAGPMTIAGGKTNLPEDSLKWDETRFSWSEAKGLPCGGEPHVCEQDWEAEEEEEEEEGY